jgi:hypothetical protein
MHRASLTAAALLAGLILLPAHSSAQNWPEPWADPEDRPPRLDLAVSAGVLAPTDWSNLVLLGSISSASGVVEQILARELRVDADKAYGGALTYWEGRYGFRVQGAYSKSSLKIGGSAPVGIKTWLYDMRGVIGTTEYKPGRIVWPYGFVGFGGITYDLAQTVSPPLTFITQAPTISTAPNTIIVGDRGRQFVLSEDELGAKTVFAVSFGVGTDFRIPVGPGGFGVRVEVSDHIAPSPLDLRISELSALGAALSDRRVHFGAVHHVTATAGFVVQIGR